MPTGTIEFLQVPGSMSSGEYPLFTGGSQSLGSMRLWQTTAKFRMDLAQSIRVPYFDGCEDVNMLRFDKSYWWVTNLRTSSDSDRAIVFDVEYSAPSSLVFQGTNLTGIFRKLPINVCPYMSMMPVTSAMQFERQEPLPMLPEYAGRQLFWVQITSTAYIPVDVTTAEEALQKAKQDQLTTYGAFVMASDSMIITDTMKAVNGSTSYFYPSLYDVISNPEHMGIAASTITDISISIRCPFDYTLDATDGTIQLYATHESHKYPIEPDHKMTYVYSQSGDVQSTATIAFYSDMNGRYDERTDSLTLQLTSSERLCGSVSLRSHSQATVASVPTSWSDELEMTVRAVSDYSGIYTQVLANGEVFVIPEGHLPYIGSAWAEYQAYSQAFDRQSMEFTISQARDRMNADLLGSIANTAVSGAVVGAIVGGPVGAAGGALTGAVTTLGGVLTSAASGMVSYSMETERARFEQSLTEKRTQAAGGTPYNVGYGLVYVLQCILHAACLRVDMPSNMDDTVLDDFVSVWGYPAENKRTVPAQTGYYEGMLLSESSGGPRFDRLNRAMMSGLRFIEVL